MTSWARGRGGVSEIMINSLILILNKEENPMTRGRGGSILGKISMTSFLNSPYASLYPGVGGWSGVVPRW